MGPKPENSTTQQWICLGLLKQQLWIEQCQTFLAENPIEVSQIPNAYAQFEKYLETSIAGETLNTWFQTPPPVYAVANPGRENHLKSALQKAQLTLEPTPLGYVFPPATDLQSFIEEGFCRIMDLGSQLSVQDLPLQPEDALWDCCCGSGGKSLMLLQLYPEITLYASDLRENIIPNLKRRFQLAGMKAPFAGANNMAKLQTEILFENNVRFSKPVFNYILADVPCTGSGTWRRNPEELHFFNPDKIGAYAAVQRSIVQNALQFLKPGGYLIYITCSIFVDENLNNIETLSAENGLDILKYGMVGGFDMNADYLFCALLKKNANN